MNLSLVQIKWLEKQSDHPDFGASLVKCQSFNILPTDLRGVLFKLLVFQSVQCSQKSEMFPPSFKTLLTLNFVPNRIRKPSYDMGNST
jgi:hypothetical protein